MRRRCAAGTTTGDALEIVRIVDDAAVLADCRAIGRQAQAERCALRRRAGLHFFSLRRAGRSIANTWAIRGGERFLDEAMLVFELGANDACLRDMYVDDAERGKRVFGQFVRALEAGPLAGIERLWSCVEAGNAASLFAHRHCSFEAVGDVSTLAFFNRLMLRRWRIPAELHCREFAATRRVLWLDAPARAFRQAHLA